MEEKELILKVSPYTDTGKYFVIRYKYRYKKTRKTIFFGEETYYTEDKYKLLVEVCDFLEYSVRFNQPVFFETFDLAIEYAKKLKENPSLLEEHYKREQEKYDKAIKRLEDLKNVNKNKTLII